MKRANQIDKGPLRKHITAGEKRVLKKIHKKLIRKMAKDPTKTPRPNRYYKWAV